MTIDIDNIDGLLKAVDRWLRSDERDATITARLGKTAKGDEFIAEYDETSAALLIPLLASDPILAGAAYTALVKIFAEYGDLQFRMELDGFAQMCEAAHRHISSNRDGIPETAAAISQKSRS